MKEFNIGIELPDGSIMDISLDTSSLGDLGHYSENEMDEELRYLIKNQYPDYVGKIVNIYC